MSCASAPVCPVLPVPPAPLEREPAGRARWQMPRRWSEQQPLLERQHQRLELLLTRLIAQHRSSAGGSAAEQQQGCRALLRALRLHLRLEERWLGAHGLLCPGHRAGHQALLETAASAWRNQGAECGGRLELLESLQTWFLQHLQGADAVAYGRAAALSPDPSRAAPGGPAPRPIQAA